MDLKITNVALFNNNFINNISKLTDSCILSFKDNFASCITANSDNTIINYSKLSQDSDYVSNSEIKINLPDVKKLIKIFSCINDNPITLNYDKNNISYSNKSFKFRYHLLDDGIISAPKINIDKISALQFNSSFTITKNDISNILKASSIALDITKLYIFTEDNNVFCDFTDNSRHNVDSVAFKISDSIEGDLIKTPVPINFEVIRVISSIKTNQINVKYNSKIGTFLFELEDSTYMSKYVVSALVS
jgi:hypothetical protein